MHFLLVAVVIGLTCAEAISPEEVSGAWRTIAIAADNLEKIEENGPLRAFVRFLEVFEEGAKLSLRFFVKSNGVCQEFVVEGTKRQEDDVYTGEYSGTNEFQIVGREGDVIAFFNTNRDEAGTTTRMVLVAGKRDYLTPEEEQRLVEFVEAKNIPTENIEYVSPSDTCPN